MVFIETPTFTKVITGLVSDDDYRGLQGFLANNPKAGDVILGCHGLRKIRWRSVGSGGGKSGGIRTIYYCLPKDQIYMLYAYDKRYTEDLTKKQLKQLAEHVKGGVI